MYSQYKSSNTFKLLIALSPILNFNFVSKLYSGRISDKEIVNVSGFLERKEEQRERITKDQGMLDMSLDIEWLDWLSDNLTQEDNWQSAKTVYYQDNFEFELADKLEVT